MKSKFNIIIIIIILFVFSLPSMSEWVAKNLTLIQAIKHNEDDKGLTLEFNLNQPLKNPPKWFLQGNNIFFSFENAYINPPKIQLPVNSKKIDNVVLVQFDQKITRAVIYWKGNIPAGISPAQTESDDKLKLTIFVPYTANIDNKAVSTSSDNPKATVSIQVTTTVQPTVIRGTTTSSDQLFYKAPIIKKQQSNQKIDKTTPLKSEDDLSLNLEDKEKTEIPNFSKSIFRSFLYLLVILGLLILTIYFLKRFFFKEVNISTSTKSLKIISSIYIGDKKRICLIEVLGRILVLGVTPTSIDLLTEIEGDKVVDIVSEMEKDQSSKKSFKKTMKDAEDKFDSEKIDKKAKNLTDTLKNILSKDQ
jgi:flagellar biosynthetic protein FliO